MMKKVFVYLFVIISSVVYAQDIELLNTNILKKQTVGHYPEIIVTASHIDNENNLYIATYAHHENCAEYSGGCYTYELLKFDDENNFLWQYNFADNNIGHSWFIHVFSSFINGITSDTNGNVYIVGNYGCPEGCNFGNFFLNHDDISSSDMRGFLAKCNQENGNIFWIWADVDEGMKGFTDIKFHEDTIYASYYGKGDVYKNDNESLTFTKDEDIGILKCNSSGLIFSSTGIENNSYYDYNLINPNNYATISSRLIVANPKIHIADNNFFLTGGASGRYSAVGENLYEEPGQYVFANNDSDGWFYLNQYLERAIGSNYVPAVLNPKSTSDGEHFYTVVNFTEDRYVNISGTTDSVDKGCVIQKFSTESNNSIWNFQMIGDIYCNDIIDCGDGILFAGTIKDSVLYDDEYLYSEVGMDDIILMKIDYEGQYVEHVIIGSIMDDYPYTFIKHGNLIDLLGYTGYNLTSGDNVILNKSEATFKTTVYELTTEIENELAIDESPVIYPNPTSDVFIIKNKNLKIVSISNSLGQNMSYSSYDNKFDISNFPQGIYFVSFDNNQSSILIKQ